MEASVLWLDLINNCDVYLNNLTKIMMISPSDSNVDLQTLDTIDPHKTLYVSRCVCVRRVGGGGWGVE